MKFNLNDWLTSLKLIDYLSAFEDEGFDEPDVLIELEESDFQDIGITKKGHLIKLRKAIVQLKTDTQRLDETTVTQVCVPDSSPINNLTEHLPQFIALPLKEYIEEDHPGMKLWAACDTIEMLLRFLVIVAIAEQLKDEKFEPKLLKQLQGKIEMPTLGAWLAMALALMQHKKATKGLLPELKAFIEKTLKNLLYGIEKPGTADSSFLAMRNRLAHGGGLTKKEAARLLAIWQGPFEQTMLALDWLGAIDIVGRDGSDALTRLHGTDKEPKSYASENTLDGDSASVWLVKGNETLSLWPLLMYDRPSAPSPDGNNRTAETSAVQIYVRRDVVRLQFTPLGTEGFSHSEGDESSLQLFNQLFSLDKTAREKTAQSFKVQPFTRELQKDASQMVGRYDEQATIEALIQEKDNNLIWITGPAGMGKSFLMARLAVDLMEAHEESKTIVLPYRFKAGDDARCNRDAYATYVTERLESEEAFIDVGMLKKEGKAEERLKSSIDALALDKKLILLVDGLDELLSKDKDFVKDFPATLRHPRVIWVCAGRPEPELMKVFDIYQAVMPFPEGLPPMRSQDIRGMILEKIGPLKKKLLAQDKEQGDEVVNPFIALVEKRADGLPLYVKYVIGDLLSNRYRVLDGDEQLPTSLTAYHEKLIDEMSLGDLKAVLTPLAALLAVAYEPLSEDEIYTFLVARQILPGDDLGIALVAKGLASLAGILRQLPDPEGEMGYTLFHASLREHMLSTPAMAATISVTKTAMAQAALNPEADEATRNYLYRLGIDHLLDDGRLEEARLKLLDLNYLYEMLNRNVPYLYLLLCWQRVGNKEDIDNNYATILNEKINLFEEIYTGEQLVRRYTHLREFMWFAGYYKSAIILDHKIDELREIKLKKEMSSISSSLGENHHETLKIMFSLGEFYSESSELCSREELIEYLENTKTKQIKTLGTDHPDTIKTFYLLGKLFCEGSSLHQRLHEKNPDSDWFEPDRRIAEYKEAGETYFREALEQEIKTKGIQHPSIIKKKLEFGPLTSEIDHVRFYDELSQLIERSTSFGNEDKFNCLWELGNAYKKQNEVIKAFQKYKEACLVKKSILGDNHPDYIGTLVKLSFIYRHANEYQESINLLQKIHMMRKKYLDPLHPDILDILSNLASVYQEMGDYASAIKHREEVYSLTYQMFGKYNVNTTWELDSLIVLHLESGNISKAQSMLSQLDENQISRYNKNDKLPSRAMKIISNYLFPSSKIR